MPLRSKEHHVLNQDLPDCSRSSIHLLPPHGPHAVTGACFIVGYTGSVTSARYTAALDTPPPKTAEDKTALARKFLSSNGVPSPAGEGKERRNLFAVGRPTGRQAVLAPLRENAKEATVAVNIPRSVLAILASL